MTLGNFVTSTMGMLSQSHAMEQISMNIANVNTVGYKKSQTMFATQMTQSTERGINNNSFSAGVRDRRLVDIAGFTNASNSLYDLAVSGSGFFVVQQNNQQLYSRAGDFRGTAVPPVGFPAKPINFYQPEASSGVTTQQPSANYLTNGSGFYVMGWNANPETGAYSSSLEPVIVSPPEYYPGKATTKMDLKGNVPSNATETQKLSFPVYDNKFDSHSMVMRWEPQSNANTWNLTFDVEGATVVSQPAEIRFNESAQIVSPYPSTTFQVQWDDGSTSSIEVDLSKVTQYSTALLGEVKSQDGKPFGTLINRSWDTNGVLTAYYGNGTNIPICKVALAQVQVPNMMEAISGNMFEYNAKAGDLNIVDLQETSGRHTQIIGNALETSNVKLEDEFTYMIVTQRAYSSSANAFTTGNEMLQEAIKILG